MVFVDDTQRSELMTKAVEALSTTDPSTSHTLYRDIVETLTRLCNKNQKEIANELQQLAKALEAQGKSGEAFEFKQRTCAVMLEISMEDRRRMKTDGVRNADAPPRSIIPASSNEHHSEPKPVMERSEPRSIIGVETSDLQPVESATTPGAATTSDTALPFISLEYLYLGSSDYERDLSYYSEVLGAQEVWKFDRFGSRITAFSVSNGPLLLLADHRGGPSCQPVFRVADLANSARELGQRGWQAIAGPFGTPNGEAYSFQDPSGNRFAIFQVDETSTDRAYYDPTEAE